VFHIKHYHLWNIKSLSTKLSEYSIVYCYFSKSSPIQISKILLTDLTLNAELILKKLNTELTDRKLHRNFGTKNTKQRISSYYTEYTERGVDAKQCSTRCM